MNALRFASLAALLVATTATAHADGIVLESYVGARPAEAKYLPPILDELSKHSFVVGYDAVGRKYENRVSRSAGSKVGLPKTFKADVARGQKEWARGRFDEALKILTPAIEVALANPAAFIEEPALRETLQSALIALALSRKGQGDPDGMRQAFAELARSFPTANLGADYGPDANRAFEAVKRDLLAPRAVGQLNVRLSDQSQSIYINERSEGVASARKSSTPPGEYRVLARSPDQGMSRVHRVIVPSGGQANVTIDALFDAVLHFAPDWNGLKFPTLADRTRLEGAYAMQIANAVDASAVVVLGIETVNGRPSIVGSLVNLVNGRDLRRASIAIDSAPQEDRLRALAKFLAGEDAASGIDVLFNGVVGGLRADAPVEAASSSAERDTLIAPSRPSKPLWRGWKWVATGSAAASLITGGALFYYDGKCSEMGSTGTCSTQYNTAGASYAFLGVGAALTGVSLYLWLTEEPDPATVPLSPARAPAKAAFVAPAPGGAIAGISGSF